MHDWLVLLAVGAGTYLMRVAFLLTRHAAPPDAVARTLPHIAPAVLAAIVVPALILPQGVLSVGGTAPAVTAAVVCCAAWWRTRSLPLALIGGLLSAWGVTAVLAIWG